MQLLEILVLGLVLGSIHEEFFFRGMSTPSSCHTVPKTLAVVLTLLLFALFHCPANLVHWASQRTSSGIALEPHGNRLTIRQRQFKFRQKSAYRSALSIAWYRHSLRANVAG
jgi:membrane protease YdiL (CAAX protease family)